MTFGGGSVVAFGCWAWGYLILIHRINLPCIILEFPDGFRPPQTVGHVREIRLRTHYREGLRVDLIHTVSRVQTRQRCDGRSDVGHLERFGEVDLCGVAELSGFLAARVGGKRSW